MMKAAGGTADCIIRDIITKLREEGWALEAAEKRAIQVVGPALAAGSDTVSMPYIWSGHETI